MTKTATIKFFWNGLKDSTEPRAPGKSPSLVRGHWSYQEAEANIWLETRIRFYFKGYDDRANEIAASFAGTPATSTIDDCFRDAHFDITPEGPRWAEALAMFVKQEERALIRMERRHANYPSTYLAGEIKHARSRVASLSAKPEGDSNSQIDFLAQIGAL